MSRRALQPTVVMLIACIVVFLTAIDQTVVVTAFIQIISDLQIPTTQLDHAAWIVSGYLLGYVIVMPLMGRVSDLYGRRRVFLICLGVFALGSLFCGLAPILGQHYDLAFLQALGIDTSSPGLIWLVIARFVQAAGGGAIVPVAMAVAGDIYQSERRALALGIIGMVTEAGGVIGPLYGSLILQTPNLGWQYIFYFNVPLCLIFALLVIWFIPARGVVSEQRATSGRRIDVPGALLLGLSLTCLSLGLSQEAVQFTAGNATTISTNTGTATSANNPWLIALAILLLAAFIGLELWNERRGKEPLIPLSLFRRLPFSSTSLMSFLIGAALIISMVNIPLFFLSVFNQDSIASGLALLRLTAMIPVGAIIGGWLCSRIGCRWTAILGLLPAMTGFWLMHLWDIQIDWSLITISTLLTGFGLGLVIAPISTTALNSAQPQQLGVASSTVTVLRMTGMILGLAALTSWGLGNFRSQMGAFKPPANAHPLTPAYNAAYAHYLTQVAHNIYSGIFLAAGILCLIALIPAFGLLQTSTSRDFIRTKSTDDLLVSSETKENLKPSIIASPSEEQFIDQQAQPQPANRQNSQEGLMGKKVKRK